MGEGMKNVCVKPLLALVLISPFLFGIAFNREVGPIEGVTCLILLWYVVKH
jgi:hypothetical protein